MVVALSVSDGAIRNRIVVEPVDIDGVSIVPDDGGQPGWLWDGVSIPPAPVVDTEALRERMLADLSAIRYAREIGGCIVSGVEVRTDRESQSLLTGAAVSAMLNPAYTVAWKAVSGWVTLDAAAILGLASAVRAHVQACFDRERELSDMLASAADAAALAAVDIAAGWPSVSGGA